jgi:hypothetical protein
MRLRSPVSGLPRCTPRKPRFLPPFVPASSTFSRPKKRPTAKASGVRPPLASALVLLNQGPLQRTAWAEYHTARKRHEKAARDLHRHEEVDSPAHERWLNQTFPVHLTDLRNLQEEVATKTQQVRLIRALSAYTGRSAKRLWAEFKENGGRMPEDGAEDRKRRTEDGEPNSDDARKASNHRPDSEDDFFGRDEPPPYRGRGQSAAGRLPPSAVRHNSPVARDIYRRLVQKLHPDRGGEFTPARKRLWHEVQQAWAEGDADWLARLEVELDSTADLGLLGLRETDPLSIRSPLSRLRRAIAELQAARRDTERKLAAYRKTPPWRFTLTKQQDKLMRRTLAQLEKDTEFFQRQLDHLNQTIAGWEEPSLGRTKARHTLPDW